MLYRALARSRCSMRAVLDPDEGATSVCLVNSTYDSPAEPRFQLLKAMLRPENMTEGSSNLVNPEQPF